MSRDVLKIANGGFAIYDEHQVRKVNAMRMALSQPDMETPAKPTKGDVLFTTAEEQNEEPSSCYNCIFYNYGKSCSLIGPRVKIRKFVYPKEATADSKPIEYWPCCGMNFHGEPNRGEPVYRGSTDPDYVDLIWINAPKVGQEYGGANCGGVSGGDDCDHYIVEGREKKWESPTGYCRVLGTTVAAGDDCCQWEDDDRIDWREAVRIIEEQDGTS